MKFSQFLLLSVFGYSTHGLLENDELNSFLSTAVKDLF